VGQTRFLLVPHGEADWNVERRVQRHSDRPLTQAGIAQARALAQQLADMRLRESSKHNAEDQVAPRRLSECAWVREKRRHACLTACGVVAVGEEAQRVQHDVLGEGHRHCKLPPLDRQTPSRLVVGEPEESAVQRVHGEPGGAPVPPPRDGLAQDGDVGVVAAEDAAIQRLLSPPDEGRQRSCKSGAKTTRHRFESCSTRMSVNRHGRSAKTCGLGFGAPGLGTRTSSTPFS
jgi:hypothetical protein